VQIAEGIAVPVQPLIDHEQVSVLPEQAGELRRDVSEDRVALRNRSPLSSWTSMVKIEADADLCVDTKLMGGIDYSRFVYAMQGRSLASLITILRNLFLFLSPL